MISPQDQLANLLLALFSVGELTRFVAYHYDTLRSVKPKKGTTLVSSTRTIAEELLDAGVVDAAFFDRLRAERPDRAAEIDRVAGTFTGAGAEPEPRADTPTPTPPEISEKRQAFRARMKAALEVEAAPEPILTATAWTDAAAVLDDFDPFTLCPVGGEADATRALEALTPHCDDSPTGRWVLDHDARRVALAALYRDQRLPEVIAANPHQAGPRTRWLQRLLGGEDVTKGLAELSLASLGELDEVLDWFDGVTTFGVDRRLLDAHLERLRTVSPLQKLSGVHFRGRKDELAKLEAHVEGAGQNWIVVLHGSGGVGKSSLLGRFLLEHQRSVGHPIPWVYLDFDDPTHDPRHPKRLVEALARQLSLLYATDPDRARGFLGVEGAAASDGLSFARLAFETVDGLARELAAQLATVAPDAPFLVVMDTFENVQIQGERAVERVRKLLDALHDAWPKTRAIVSGRGPVEEWDVPHMPLHDLDAESADAVLEARGIAAPERRALIVKRFGTNPLTLGLASTAFEKADADEEFPDIAQDLLAAQQIELQGQLYTRILGHIRDPEVRRLAHPGLVVRLVNRDVIRHVLAEPCGLKPARAGEIMDKLVRYMSMFERVDGETLRHRPDVRSAMLRLILRDPERAVQVRAIHDAAIAWYRKGKRPADRAELLYHLLAIDAERAALQEVWSSELAGLLRTAWDDPLPARARAWLGARLGLLRGDAEWELADWEVHAEREANVSLETGDPAGALRVLAQRTERVPGSPLFRLEAQARLRLGEADAAWEAVQRGAASMLEADANAELLKLRLLAIEVAAARKDAASVDAQAEEASRLVAALDDRAADLRLQEIRQNARRDLGLEGADVTPQIVRSFLATDDQTLRRNPALSARIAKDVGRRSAPVLRKAAGALGNQSDAGIFRPDAFALESVLEKAAGAPEGRARLDRLASEVGLDAQTYDFASLASNAIRYGRMGDAIRASLDASGDDEEVRERIVGLITL